MKRIISMIAGVALVLGLMAGCGENQNQTEQMMPNTQQSQQQTQTPPQNTADTPSFIGEEKAKEIALSQVGITADGVTFERVELENDDGVWQYEIEFKQGNTEYDVNVKADDGIVIKSEKDIND